jgi:poly(A) polymerase
MAEPEIVPQPGDEAIVLSKPEHGISRRRIDADALRIIFRLHHLGHTAYLTGGAVRDLLLGKTPKDFDIVTDARPGQIKKYFHRVFIIGRRFRLAHVHFAGGKVIEVATFRKYSSSSAPAPPQERSNPEALYGTPREDAWRRDITINALFFDAAASTLIDYVGGLADLRLKRIRIIGDCGERFREDPVRIWRVIRYAARAGFAIGTDTEREIMAQRGLLQGCSGARLFEEFFKDLSHAASTPVFEGLQRYGLLAHIIGKAGKVYQEDEERFARLVQLLEIEDCEKANGYRPMFDELCAVFFWPWLEAQLVTPPATGDSHELLKNALLDAGMSVQLPKSLRAQVVDILVLVAKMIRALRTGRVRWTMRGRSHYVPASRLCFLFEKGRAPAAGESFESLFSQAFPQAAAPMPARRRRRPRRKSKPPAL